MKLYFTCIGLIAVYDFVNSRQNDKGMKNKRRSTSVRSSISTYVARCECLPPEIHRARPDTKTENSMNKFV